MSRKPVDKTDIVTTEYCTSKRFLVHVGYAPEMKAVPLKWVDN